MGQNHLAAEARGSGVKRVGDVAEQQAVGRWHAVFEAVDLAIKDVNLAFRQIRAQVIVGAAMTQPHLEHDALTAGYLPESPFQADDAGPPAGTTSFSSRVNLSICLLYEIVPADLDGLAGQVNDGLHDGWRGIWLDRGVPQGDLCRRQTVDRRLLQQSDSRIERPPGQAGYTNELTLCHDCFERSPLRCDVVR